MKKVGKQFVKLYIVPNFYGLWYKIFCIYVCTFLLQVKTYAVQDQSQSIRYISQFFVHAKNKRSDDHEASDKYHIVVSVMITAIIFPLSLLLTFTAMDRFLIHPKLYSFLKQTDNATNRNNTAEQPGTGTAEQPRTGTVEQPRTGTAEQPRTGTAEQPRTGTAEQPRTGTAEQPRTGTGEQPRTGTAEQPRTGTAEQPRTGTAEQPRTGTGEQPRTGTGEQPRTGTAEQPRTGTAEQPRTGTGEQPRTGTGEQQRTGTAEQPRTGTAEQPHAVAELQSFATNKPQNYGATMNRSEVGSPDEQSIIETNSAAENNNEQHATESSLLIELLYNKDLKIAHTLALLSLSIVLHLFLLTIYCLSIWKFFEYSEELFCHDYDFDDDDDSDCVTGDHLIPIFQVIVSATIIILVYLTKIFLFCKTVVSCWTTETKENRLARWTVPCYERVTSSNNCLVKWICKTENNQKDHLVTFTLSSLGANITIAGIYFAPYILLAFLTAPQEAIFFYFIVTVFLAVSYIFFLALFALCYTGEEFRRQLIIIIGATISTAYFFVAFILVLTLGNINNFQDVQTVLFALLLALLSIFVFKPIYEGIQTKIEEKEKRIRHHE